MSWRGDFKLAEVFIVCLILLLAAWLRFGWSGVNSFAFDEARLSLISLDMARGGEFAALGMPSSVGVPNLPAAAWIYAIPYLFSTDPLVATQFTGFLSLGAVFGVWLLARRGWGAWAGMAAALYMATSPYSVLYSRSIWAQNLLPVLALAWGWAGFIGAARKNRAAIAANIFLAGFVFQVHFAGIALGLGSLYLIARYGWWRRPAPILIGGGLALLALLPFVARVMCCAPEVIDQFRNALGGSPQIDGISFQETARLAYGSGWQYLSSGARIIDFTPDLTGLVGIFKVIGLLAGLIAIFRTLAVNVGAQCAAPLREHDANEATRRPTEIPACPEALIGMERVASINSKPSLILAEITLVWLIVSPLFFVRYTTPVFVHYQLASLPAIALVIGAGTQLFKRRWWPPLIAILMIVTAYQWSMEIRASLNRAENFATPDGLGTPLEITRNVANSVPENTPVLFFTHGGDSSVNGEAAVFDVLWWGRESRIINGESLLILPPYPALLMATLAPFQAWEEIEAANLAQDVRAIDRRKGEGPGFVATLYDGEFVSDSFTPIEPIVFADGVQLEGWKARIVGPRLRISTLWRVLESPPAGTYQQFHHLRSAESLEGQPLMISDVPISTHDWRVGDRLIVMGDFFVDQQTEFWVDVGHYSLPDVSRILRLDGTGDNARLGPFNLS
jgi:Dolichyl-phosphate-mannose-protein mannosyltransferase